MFYFPVQTHDVKSNSVAKRENCVVSFSSVLYEGFVAVAGNSLFLLSILAIHSLAFSWSNAVGLTIN